MKHKSSPRLALATQLTTAKDLPALRGALAAVAEHFGATVFLLAQVNYLPCGVVIKQIDNLPAPAAEAFREEGQEKADTCPVAAQLRADGTAFYWDRSFYEQHNATTLWEEGFRFAGQNEGIAAQINCWDSEPRRTTTLAFDWTIDRAADRDMLPSFLEDLSYFAIAVHAQAALLYAKADEPTSVAQAAQVTTREWEALLWSSRGMTDIDTAQILHVSPRTVRKRIDACIAKLGASSRNHAAAIASRLGFLEAPDTPSVTQVLQLRRARARDKGEIPAQH